MNKKTYTLFAGVNGSGKSTLFEIINKGDYGIRINTDELVGNEWRNGKAQIRAGKKALEMRRDAFKKGEAINQETTLTGHGILKSIEHAKSIGYKIIMYYVSVESPAIAIERVKNRVLRGGHGIPNATIERRYYESLENLKKIKNMCDEIKIYDNSKIYDKAIIIKNGTTTILNNYPAKWIETLMELKK